MTKNIFVKTQREGDFRIQLSETRSIKDTKSCLQDEIFRKSGMTKNYRLLRRGENMADGKRLKSISSDDEIIFHAVEDQSEIRKKLDNVGTLHRNVKECLKCAQRGTEPRERERFNSSEFETPIFPTGNHLADLLGETSQTFAQMATQMKNLTLVLSATDGGARNSQETFDEHRKIVQNNIDGLRYSAHLFQNLTKICVPIDDPKAFLRISN